MTEPKSFIDKVNSNRLIFLFSLLLSLMLYGNTLNHGYALDDAIVIQKNEFTKQGINGISAILTTDSFTGFFGRQKNLVAGGRYRPLSLITFALEYHFFGEFPFMSHLINLLIYALIGFLVFLTISDLLKTRLGESTSKTIALLSAFLFLIHPIHTEAVANIKGRDELMSLLFALLATHQSLKYADKLHWRYLISIAIFLFLGSLSKENALTFLFIIPLSVWFFRPIKLKPLFVLSFSLVLSSFVFLIIRQKILGGLHTQIPNELMNNPFLGASFADKLATILLTWLIYIKLLVFPHPLTFDYYPYHIPITTFADFRVLLMIVILALLTWIVIRQWKKKPLLSYSILGFAISFSVVSNLFFPVGTFMNERFIFMPSFFWCLGIIGGLTLFYQHQTNKKIVKTVLIIIAGYSVLFYPIKTIARNKAWKDDLTLFTTDVKTSQNSAKSNCSAGGKLWKAAKATNNEQLKQSYFKKSEIYLKKAVQIYPEYADAWLLLGNLLFDKDKDTKQSVAAYFHVLKKQPQNEFAIKNIDIVAQQSTDRKFQLDTYKTLYPLDSVDYLLNYRMGVLYGRYFNQLNKSVYYLEKAVHIDGKQVEALKDLATAYGMTQQPEKAYNLLKKAISLAPDDSQIYYNLGVACMQLNKKTEADGYFKQAESLKTKP